MLTGIRWRIQQAQQLLQTERRARQRRATAQALVLLYHRVTEKTMDPWALGVTPENFEAHLRVLRRYTQPMSLRDLAIAQQSGHLPERAVAITFDDGYANNLHQAKPLLAKYDIPATVFVSTGYTERGREFWWDDLDRMLLQPGPLPDYLELRLDGQMYRWDLGSAAHYSVDQHQADWGRSPLAAQPGSRLYFYCQVWTVLQPLSEPQRAAALDHLLTWAGANALPRATHRPLVRAELPLLEADGVVTIGAHTENHPILSKHDLAYQQREIEASKIYLEHALNHRVDAFAYPFGAYQPETVPLVQQAGFFCACSTVEETVWRGNNRLELPRFEVQDWPEPVFEARLQQWLKRGY
jgi:peptidoglycan/xylan/chitin deacetylase (PgdA/CDA1 family)